jgi:hypothetical protein
MMRMQHQRRDRIQKVVMTVSGLVAMSKAIARAPLPMTDSTLLIEENQRV